MISLVQVQIHKIICYCLELFFLFLALALACFDSLHQTKTRGLDFGNLVVLLLHTFLVGSLEAFNESLEIFFSLGHFSILFGDGLIKILVRHSLNLFDLCLLFIIAKINVGRRTDGLEVLIGKFLERIEITATLVIFKSGWITPLDGRVSTDTLSLTEWFALGSAIHISNKLGWGISECVHKLVPIRLHFLTVASPRSKELDEDCLTSGSTVVILGRELNGVSGGGRHGQHGKGKLHGQSSLQRNR
mmetsp:Transcript_21112/g.29824  ORF Transcript_21112/g.29824 Transcript_21112/m.29824 type:complete len:246 (-) Transcript_21112:18-755(-)